MFDQMEIREVWFSNAGHIWEWEVPALADASLLRAELASNGAGGTALGRI
jgi:hypothetical protein